MDDTKDGADGGLSTLVLEALDNDATEGAKVERSKATQKQVKATAKRVQDALRAVRQTAEGSSEDEEMDAAPAPAPAPAKDDVTGQLDEFPQQVCDGVWLSHCKLWPPVFKSSDTPSPFSPGLAPISHATDGGRRGGHAWP
jgi:hypothetical protein